MPRTEPQVENNKKNGMANLNRCDCYSNQGENLTVHTNNALLHLEDINLQ